MDEKLEKVNFLGQYLSSSRSLDQILEMTMIISQDILGYDHAIIRIVDGDYLVSRKWIGFPREAVDLPIRIGEGITGEVARTGKAILVEDILTEPRFLFGAEGARSELCVPIMYDKKTIGVFNVESEKPAFFTERDKNLLETLTSQVASAIEGARLREELERAEKLSVVGSMASSILHDIRNDIHQLRVCSDLLKKKDIEMERVEKVSEWTRRAADNIYGLIEDIFDFVKTGSARLDKKPVDVASLLESIADRIKSAAPDNVDVRLDTARGVTLDLDERRFRRMMLNLANNAIEAMPDGGTLEITARKDAGGVVFQVRDTGIGIEKERLSKIWEPLYTHGKKQGTGLGMAIVKKVVEEHNWKVEADSEPGVGTVFTIIARG